MKELSEYKETLELIAKWIENKKNELEINWQLEPVAK